MAKVTNDESNCGMPGTKPKTHAAGETGNARCKPILKPSLRFFARPSLLKQANVVFEDRTETGRLR